MSGSTAFSAISTSRSIPKSSNKTVTRARAGSTEVTTARMPWKGPSTNRTSSPTDRRVGISTTSPPATASRNSRITSSGTITGGPPKDTIVETPFVERTSRECATWQNRAKRYPGNIASVTRTRPLFRARSNRSNGQKTSSPASLTREALAACSWRGRVFTQYQWMFSSVISGWRILPDPYGMTSLQQCDGIVTFPLFSTPRECE